MNDQDKNKIYQNGFGILLITALAACGVTDIRRDDRIMLDDAFQAAYEAVERNLGSEMLRNFSGIVISPGCSLEELAVRTSTVNAILGFLIPSHLVINHNNPVWLHVILGTTPDEAIKELHLHPNPEVWMHAAHVFKSRVETFSSNPYFGG